MNLPPMPDGKQENPQLLFVELDDEAKIADPVTPQPLKVSAQALSDAVKRNDFEHLREIAKNALAVLWGQAHQLLPTPTRPDEAVHCG
jgi:hypothetical protein